MSDESRYQIERQPLLSPEGAPRGKNKVRVMGKRVMGNRSRIKQSRPQPRATTMTTPGEEWPKNHSRSSFRCTTHALPSLDMWDFGSRSKSTSSLSRARHHQSPIGSHWLSTTGINPSILGGRTNVTTPIARTRANSIFCRGPHLSKSPRVGFCIAIGSAPHPHHDATATPPQ
jgi:hypothetical protein